MSDQGLLAELWTENWKRGRQATNARLHELLIRMRARDTAAFSELHRLTFRSMIGVVLRVGGSSRPDAEEVAQETYLRLWQRAAHYDPTKSCPTTWIMSCARNSAIDRLRRESSRANGRSTADDELDVVASDAEGPLAQFLRTESELAARRALQGLAPPIREAIQLSYFEGLSHVEVSSRMGRPLGTIKSWIRRGLQQLAAVLKRHD